MLSFWSCRKMAWLERKQTNAIHVLPNISRIRQWSINLKNHKQNMVKKLFPHPFPWPTKTQPYMSHLKAKIKRPVFQKNSTKQEDREFVMCYLDLCIQLFSFPKDNVKSLSGQNFKNVNIKNIKMKPPVAQFKKKSKKLCLFLKC